MGCQTSHGMVRRVPLVCEKSVQKKSASSSASVHNIRSQALAGFTPQQQADWLKFVTACSRAPLLGFKHLSPQLCIAKAGQESDPASQDRLPTSATCMNLLKLPPMKSPQQIAAKLLYAIENVAGFDLS